MKACRIHWPGSMIFLEQKDLLLLVFILVFHDDRVDRKESMSGHHCQSSLAFVFFLSILVHIFSQGALTGTYYVLDLEQHPVHHTSFVSLVSLVEMIIDPGFM